MALENQSRPHRASRGLSWVGRVAIEKRFTAVLVLLVAEIIVFGVTQDGFLTSQNIELILTSSSILWVAAMGLTFVMLVGAFDLSVGAILQLVGIFVGVGLLDWSLPGPVVFVLALLFGAVLGGGVNGFLVGKLGLSFLMVTLGTQSLFQGASLLWSHEATRGVVSGFFNGIAFNNIFGIPILIYIMALSLVVGLYLLHLSYFGKDLYAVGGNPDAARLSGIRVERTIMYAFAIAGIGAALGGAIQVGRIEAASPNVGATVLFTAAAAVLLGGTSFAGGTGGVGGTAIGVLFLGTLTNGLSLSGLPADWQYVVTGVILIMAVVADMLQRPDGREKLRIGAWTRRSPRSVENAS